MVARRVLFKGTSAFFLILLLVFQFACDVFCDQSSGGVATLEERFSFTEAHRKLLKEVRIVWDPTENGAPTVHPSEPFGSTDVFGDIAKIAGISSLTRESRWSFLTIFSRSGVKLTPSDQVKAEQYFKDLFPSMEVLLQNGVLKAGEYKLKVKQPLSLDAGVSQLDFFASERDKKLVMMSPPRLVDGSRFSFTEEHRSLLRLTAGLLRGRSRGAFGEHGYLDVPALDPKRPYGDMTYYPLDVARELKIAIDNRDYTRDDSLPPFNMEKLRKLVELHLSMHQAMSVFLSEAQIDNGEYVKHNGLWGKS